MRGCVKMGTSSFLKKWSTLSEKQSTVFENQLTVLRKTVDPFCGKVSFRNKKRGCVYFDTPSY